MAGFSVLKDNFTDNSISASAWSSYAIGSATIAETGGQARATLPSSTAGTHEAGYISKHAYDLTADSFYINIDTMVATGVAATAFFDLRLVAGSASNVLRWRQVSNTITARHIVAGVETQVYTATWSGTTYKYLRIRESGGNILWDSSSNGTSWTNRASVAVSSLFAVTSLFVVFGASCGNIASPGSFRLEDVNLILPALSTNWRYQWARWPLTNRHKRVTIAIDTANTAQGYLVTADGVDAAGDPSGNVKYWSGPAGDGRVLTEQANQAAAEAMAVNLPVNGSFDLPSQIDARYFRLYDRSIDGAAFTIREYYPRRLVQTDDLEAESVKALHIAANEIKAYHLEATMVISNTISTAYNGARVTLSGAAFGGFIGYGATDTYSPSAGTGTYQVLWSLVDGKFYAGDGKVVLDTTGINLEVGAASVSESEVSWFHPSSASFGVTMGATHDTGAGNASAYWTAQTQSGNDASFTLTAQTNAGTPRAVLQLLGATQLVRVTTGDFEASGGDTTLTGGVNIGTATGAAAGQVLATVEDATTNAAANILTITHNSTGTPTAGFGADLKFALETSTTVDTNAMIVRASWASATHASRQAQVDFFVYDTAARLAMQMGADTANPKIGFLGATCIARPTVSGSRGGNAALASLCTALANLGLITNSTS